VPSKPFRPVDEEVLARLRRIVGEAWVRGDPEGLEPYAKDETEGLACMPEAVVKPSCVEEVSATLALAHAHPFAVTPRTGGTGVTGGAVPLAGGIVLSLERMDRILEIDEENFFAVMEPAVITGALQRAVEEKGLFYPPDPASLDSCTIGGNVAECAGGPRALKWGVTRNFVAGLQVVFADGRVSRLGGKLRKNVTGYDLIGLLVGSEGTLGVVTEITLRLLPRPGATLDLLAPFPSLEAACAAVPAMARGDEVPAVVEIMDALCLEAASDFLHKEMPFPEARAQLLVQLTGRNEEAVSQSMERAGEALLESGALDVLVAPSASMRERMWETRRQLREALLHRCPTKFSEDVCAPPARMPALIRRMKALAGEAGVEIACFGHAGDGNIHVNVLQGALSDEAWAQARPGLVRRVLEEAAQLEGTLSGEHGIGCTKRDHLSLVLDEPALEAMRAIKRALDPKGILNPGKAV